MKRADEILAAGAKHLADRAATRDQPEGERSMGRCVAAFNAMYRKDLTVEQGWQFLTLLKMSRSAVGAFNLDDYEDGAAYFALAAEDAYRERVKPQIGPAAQMAQGVTNEQIAAMSRAGAPEVAKAYTVNPGDARVPARMVITATAPRHFAWAPLPAGIDWDVAPGWADWFVIDSDGWGWWFRDEPELSSTNDHWRKPLTNSPARVALFDPTDWRESRRCRPDSATIRRGQSVQHHPV